jgi:hypothetical protein
VVCLYESFARLQFDSRQQVRTPLGVPSNSPSRPAMGLWKVLEEARNHSRHLPIPAPLFLDALRVLLLAGNCGEAAGG